MNAVFIHIPRTAGRYIMASLALERLIYPHRAKSKFKQRGRVSFGHQDYLRLVERNTIGREFARSAFIFTFVRDPFSRAVSHYHHTRRRHPNVLPRPTSFLEFTRNIDSYIFSKQHHRGVPGKRAFMPQVESIRNVPVSYIGRFERLREDIAVLARVFDVSVQTAEPVGVTKHGPYREYYNTESEDNVKKYYAEDFERFGYDDHILH